MTSGRQLELQTRNFIAVMAGGTKQRAVSTIKAHKQNQPNINPPENTEKNVKNSCLQVDHVKDTWQCAAAYLKLSTPRQRSQIIYEYNKSRQYRCFIFSVSVLLFRAWSCTTAS